MSSSEDNEEVEDIQEPTASDDDDNICDTEKLVNEKRKSKRGQKLKALPVSYDDGVARRVFIAHKSIDQDRWNHVKTILLPHPKTKSNALFLFDTRRKEDMDDNEVHFVYEVLTMIEDDGISSWFLGNQVSSNGNLYVFTPLDPLYLILPSMSKSTLAKPFLDHLIEYFPLKFAKLMHRRLSQTQLLNVAVRKVSGDIEAYLFDENKALDWLKAKVKAVAECFAQMNLTRSEASMSSHFNRPPVTDQAKSNDEYLRYACDLVGEYLEDGLKLKLQSSLGIPIESERPKRKNSDNTEEGSKRLKTESDGVCITPLEDYGSPVGETKATSKGPGTIRQKQLQQAAKGTHSLLKFFAPKPKAK